MEELTGAVKIFLLMVFMILAFNQMLFVFTK